MADLSEVENCNGFRFCKDCGKLCIPLHAKTDDQNIMMFHCENCKERECYIDPDIKNDSVIKKTQVLQSEAADILNKALIDDPSMPRKRMECINCCTERDIVYYYKPGKEERNIVIQYICVDCSVQWTSDDIMKWEKEGKVFIEFDSFERNAHILQDDEEEDDDDLEMQEENLKKDGFYENDDDDIFDDSNDINGKDEMMDI